MNYWICVLNRDNFNILVQKEIWGVADRYKNILSKVSVGDKLIFYITGESVFGGISEAASNIFIDEESIFKSIPKDRNQKFPFRIRIKPARIYKHMPKIKPLIPKLNFIKNKNRFQVHFMGKAMLPIEKDDLNIIEQREHD